MSHVAFATNNDTASGFCGLPFPILQQTGVVGTGSAGDSWPLYLTLKDVVWMYWKVKAWRVHGAISYDPGGGGDVQNFAWDWNAVIGDAAPDSASSLTDEKQLCLPQQLVSSDNLTDPDATVGFGIFYGLPVYCAAPYDLAGASILPRIQASVGDPFGIGISLSSTAGDPFSGINASMVINGVTKLLPLYQSGTVGGTYSASMAIEPAVYWAYDV